jgi:hypothetical protein
MADTLSMREASALLMYITNTLSSNLYMPQVMALLHLQRRSIG